MTPINRMAATTRSKRFPGISRIDHQISEARINSDHFGGNNYKPSDAKGDTQSHQNLGKSGREHDFGEKLRRCQPKVAASVPKPWTGRWRDAVHTSQYDGEKMREER